MTSVPRKPRIAMAVFRKTEDLFGTIEVLEHAGCDRSGMMAITGKSSVEQVVGFGLEVGPPETLAAYLQVMTEPAAIELHTALLQGNLILIVPIQDVATEIYVSRLLLEAPATSVQLHDLENPK